MDQFHPRKLNHASVFRRILAYIIDSLLVVILVFIAGWVFAAIGMISFQYLMNGGVLYGDFIRGGGFSVLYLFFVNGLILAYFTIFESKKGWGATPGKRLMNIKVVNDYGRKISIGASFLRNLLRFIWSIPCIGIFIIIIDVLLVAEKDARIGDMLAQTAVIKQQPTSYREQMQSNKDDFIYKR